MDRGLFFALQIPYKLYLSFVPKLYWGYFLGIRYFCTATLPNYLQLGSIKWNTHSKLFLV